MEEVTSSLERKFALVVQTSAQAFIQLERSLSRAAAEKQRGLQQRYNQLENARKAAQEATSQLADEKWWEKNGAWSPQAAQHVADVYELGTKWAPLDEVVRHNLDQICGHANNQWGINLKEPTWIGEVAGANEYTATTDGEITIKPEQVPLKQNEGTPLESLASSNEASQETEDTAVQSLLTDAEDPQQAQAALNAANASLATKTGAKQANAMAAKASMITDREFEKLDERQQAKQRKDLQDSGVELLTLQVADYYASETPPERAQRIDSESSTLTGLVPALPKILKTGGDTGMEREVQAEI